MINQKVLIVLNKAVNVGRSWVNAKTRHNYTLVFKKFKNNV